MGPSGLRRAVTRCQEGSISSTPPFEVCSWLGKVEASDTGEFNLSQILSKANQVIFFGERHLNIDVQEKMAELIEALSKERIQVLALEMINSRDQEAVDLYLQDDISLEEMKSIFEKGWKYESSGYMKMLEAAKKGGLKVLALDDRPRFNDSDFSENLIGRDIHMASVLNDYLRQNPTHNIIVYSGKLHAFKSLGNDSVADTIADIVKKENPLLRTSHYLMFGRKESSLLRESLKALSLKTENSFVKSEALAPYIDGAIFLNW